MPQVELGTNQTGECWASVCRHERYVNRTENNPKIMACLYSSVTQGDVIIPEANETNLHPMKVFSVIIRTNLVNSNTIKSGYLEADKEESNC